MRPEEIFWSLKESIVHNKMCRKWKMMTQRAPGKCRTAASICSLFLSMASIRIDSHRFGSIWHRFQIIFAMISHHLRTDFASIAFIRTGLPHHTAQIQFRIDSLRKSETSQRFAANSHRRRVNSHPLCTDIASTRIYSHRLFFASHRLRTNLLRVSHRYYIDAHGYM